MSKKIVVSLIIVVLFLSCKKKEQSPPIISSNPIQNSPFSVSTATAFQGFFTTINHSGYISPTNISTGIYSTAYFYSAPVSMPSWDNWVKINNLILNNGVVDFDTTWHNYRAFMPISFDAQTWQVNGNNGIPSFNYTNFNTPSSINYSSLPDSVSKGIGFTLNINGVNNITTNGFELCLFDGMNGSLNIYKPISNGNNTVTFSPAELVNLSVTSGGNYGYFYVTFINVQTLNFYGKDFVFNKQNMFSKQVKICP